MSVFGELVLGALQTLIANFFTMYWGNNFEFEQKNTINNKYQRYRYRTCILQVPVGMHSSIKILHQKK